jgi:hypothetical protein
MEWEAEPNAVGFYEKMGRRYSCDSEPTRWGRTVPVMGVESRDPTPVTTDQGCEAALASSSASVTGTSAPASR